MTSALLLAILRMAFPAGTADDPSAVAPLTPTSEPRTFWWDDAAFHAGEKAYAWSELKTTPTNGATFRIDFGSINRHRVVLEGRIDRGASKYRLGTFGIIGGEPVSNDIVVVAAKKGALSSDFRAQGATPDYLDIRGRKSVSPGDRVTFPIRGVGSSSGWCSEILKDADGSELYVADSPYRIPGLKFDYRYLWTVIEKETVHLITDIWQEEAEGYTLRVSAKDLLTDTIGSWTASVPLPKTWGKRELEFSVATLPAGFHWLHLDYLDPQGKVVHSDRARYFKPDGKAPWDGTSLGAEDTVPPPWTKPVFGADGTFACWNRTVKFGGDGVVASVTSSGRELLAEPVTLALDGKPLAFDVVRVEPKTSEGTYFLKARGSAVEVRVRCEFDGYLHFEADYPESASSFEWTVAARRSEVSVFDDCSSDDAKDMVAPGRELVRDFDVVAKPWWWLSGRNGLLGGIVDFHGSHQRDLAKSGRVWTERDAVRVRTSFVDCAVGGSGRRTVRFYLEPTPVKPKDIAFATMPQEKLRLWTGYTCDYYEAKYPGFEDREVFARFRRELDAGMRVFYYCGTQGVSPESPFWGRYGIDWNQNGIDYWAHEVPLRGKRRQTNNWAYGCPNSRSYLEQKVWGVNWMLNGPEPKMKDLYFDLADAGKSCVNVHHGCRWLDDFGRPVNGNSMESCREVHKRAYRLMKAKNADGVMYGHFNKQRTPSDAFFGFITCGESLCWKMYQNGRTYYDVLTPEMMQSLWVPKGQETTLFIGPQFHRSLECYVGRAAYDAYDPTLPWLVKAIRHFAAYVKIHDLNIYYDSARTDGGVYNKVETAVRSLGPERTYSAYCRENPAVALSAPGPRQLWAWYAKGGRGVLIVLNDTDAEVVQTVTVKGLAKRGADIFDKSACDFTSSYCTLRLGSRAAKFVEFR